MFMSNNKYCQRMKFSHLHQTIPSFLSQVTLEVTCIVLQLKTDSPKLTKKMLYTNTNKNVVVLLLNSFPSLIRQVKTRGALTPLHFIVIKITSKDNSAVTKFTSTEFLPGMTMIEKSKSFYTALCSCKVFIPRFIATTVKQ